MVTLSNDQLYNMFLKLKNCYEKQKLFLCHLDTLHECFISILKVAVQRK